MPIPIRRIVRAFPHSSAGMLVVVASLALVLPAFRAASAANAKAPVPARFAHELDPDELPKDKSGQATVMDHAIKIEPGKFLLVRQDRRLIALRVLRRTKHKTASGKTVAGAVIEYFVSADGDLTRGARHEAKVAEDYEDQRFLYIHIPKLRLEWSSGGPAGDWIYAPDHPHREMTVARTGWSSRDRINPADGALTWFRLRKPRTMPPDAVVSRPLTGEGLVLMLSVLEDRAALDGPVRIRVTFENRGDRPARVIVPPDINRRGGWWHVGSYRFDIKGPLGSYQYVSGGVIPLGIRRPRRAEIISLLPGRSVGALFDIGCATAKTWTKAARPTAPLLKEKEGKYTIVAYYDPSKTGSSIYGTRLAPEKGRITSNAVTIRIADAPGPEAKGRPEATTDGVPDGAIPPPGRRRGSDRR